MKNRINLLPKLVSLVLFFLCFACMASRATAQNVIYDWESRKLISAPSQVNTTRSANIVIKNINDILFEYKIEVVATPRSIDDWANLSGLLARAGRTAGGPAPANPPCGAQFITDAKKLINQINEVILTDPALPIKYRDIKPYKTVELKKSLAAWAKIQDKIPVLREKVRLLNAACNNEGTVKEFLESFEEVNNRLSSLERRVYSNHEVRESVTLRPETDYKVTVEEFFESIKTEGGEATFEFKPVSNQLTLTTGVLFSRIQDRGYEARKVPGMDENQLVVEGNSRLRPEGVALLNYLLPSLDNDTMGLALSAGPVIRFGSKSDLATLGFFTGVSAHLHRRLYITPGFHIGEFADFPAGFREGQAVPANFGQLDPVKRWTAKFALGISFRTASFGSLTQSAKPAVTDTKPKEGGTKAKESANKKESGLRQPSRSTELVVNRNGQENTPSETLMAVGYNVDTPDVYPSFTRNMSLRSVKTQAGIQTTLAADAEMTEYRTSIIGNTLYVVIRNAKIATWRAGLMDSGEPQIEQSGKDLIISFVLPRGTVANVNKKFNRLEIYFTPSGGGTPAPNTLIAEAGQN